MAKHSPAARSGVGMAVWLVVIGCAAAVGAGWAVARLDGDDPGARILRAVGAGALVTMAAVALQAGHWSAAAVALAGAAPLALRLPLRAGARGTVHPLDLQTREHELDRAA